MSTRFLNHFRRARVGSQSPASPSAVSEVTFSRLWCECAPEVARVKRQESGRFGLRWQTERDTAFEWSRGRVCLVEAPGQKRCRAVCHRSLKSSPATNLKSNY